MAETINTENILIGGGNMTLKFGEDTTPVDIGACSDMEVDIANKILQVECDQSIYPIAQYIIKGDVKGSVNMVEGSMRNLVIAMGGDPGDIVDDVDKVTYTIPGSAQEVPSAIMVYKVARVQDKTKFITLTLNKVQSSSGLKLTFKKDKENSFKFEFVAMADASLNNSPGKLEIDKIV